MKAKPPDRLARSPQTPRHRLRPSPRQTQNRQNRPVQGRHPPLRRPGHPHRTLARCAGYHDDAALNSQLAATLHSPQPPHPEMLAARRRPFHHPALRRHQGPRHRRTQRRHVSHPDLRRPHHRHALAAAKSRRAPWPPLLRNRQAHAGRHLPRWRSRVHFLRHRAAARWPR